MIIRNLIHAYPAVKNTTDLCNAKLRLIFPKFSLSPNTSHIWGVFFCAWVHFDLPNCQFAQNWCQNSPSRHAYVTDRLYDIHSPAAGQESFKEKIT
jgi:hypothetical protein